MFLPDPAPAVPPLVAAGVLLAARSLAQPYGVAMPPVGEILAATGGSRARAYELRDAVLALLPGLVRPPGRPRAEHEKPPPTAVGEIQAEALSFVMRHPGCVHLGTARRRYGEAFRLFVLDLRERHAEVPLADFAEAILVPPGTLEDWLRAGREPAPVDPGAPETADTGGASSDARLAQLETVLDAWRSWRGDFTTFCAHLRRDHRVELGDTLIAGILELGGRVPARRGGRSRDEEALRGAFETFFPGAQWVLDGKQLVVRIDSETFRVNLELAVDAASDAAVGISVRDEEDSAAVALAFEHGVQTTGEPPVAALLDNRPSNHTADVDAALGDTLRIRATPERPQNRAHVEGAFGLFAQMVPPLGFDTREPRALARAIAAAVATTFFSTLNRRPRRDRDGKTRVDLYAQPVTPEQREAARAALAERLRKQELARQTRAARLDPVVRALLDDAFSRLGLLDPERHVRDAIACYPRDAIVDAIAIFEGKRDAKTLPAGVDARYLLGIAKNLHHAHESDHVTEALVRERLAARDRFLDPLVRERDALLAGAAGIDQTADAFVDRLTATDRLVDRHFWLDALADLLGSRPAETLPLFRRAARRIHAAFRVTPRDRSALERRLLRRLRPLA